MIYFIKHKYLFGKLVNRTNFGHYSLKAFLTYIQHLALGLRSCFSNVWFIIIMWITHATFTKISSNAIRSFYVFFFLPFSIEIYTQSLYILYYIIFEHIFIFGRNIFFWNLLRFTPFFSIKYYLSNASSAYCLHISFLHIHTHQPSFRISRYFRMFHTTSWLLVVSMKFTFYLNCSKAIRMCVKNE